MHQNHENYPKGYVVAVLRRDHLDAVQQEIQQAGLGEVIVHTGADDPLKPQLTANLTSFGDESVALQEHTKAWEEGGVTVGIRADDQQQKQQIRQILMGHQALKMMYFGTLVNEDL